MQKMLLAVTFPLPNPSWS